MLEWLLILILSQLFLFIFASVYILPKQYLKQPLIKSIENGFQLRHYFFLILIKILEFEHFFGFETTYLSS